MLRTTNPKRRKNLQPCNEEREETIFLYHQGGYILFKGKRSREKVLDGGGGVGFRPKYGLGL